MIELSIATQGGKLETTYYTLKEVASILKVSVSTVRRAIKREDLKAIRVGKQGQLRVGESVLAQYVEEKEGDEFSETETRSEDLVIGQSETNSRNQDVRSSVRSTKANKNGKIQTPLNSRTFIIKGNHAGSDWKIINADVNDGLRLIDDESVNCIITSPPYYWQRDYGVEGQIGHEESIDGFVDVLAGTFEAAKRVLRADGVLFLNLGDTYYSAKGRPHGRDKKHNGRQMARKTLRAVDGPGLGLPRKSLIGIPWRVALAIQAKGWILRSAAIWHRPGSLGEPTAKDRPWRTYEHVFIFSKNPRYWFNRAGLNGDEDIWRIVARPENPGSHFAPYPRELVDRCLMCGCPPGGTVLDPFVGSGTTMLQALRRGSPAIGIDLNREYCDFIEHRIETELSSARNLKQRVPQHATSNG